MTEAVKGQTDTNLLHIFRVTVMLSWNFNEIMEETKKRLFQGFLT